MNGFIDIQVNGWAGVNFSHLELTLDDIGKAARELAARGTVAFCPTIFTSPWEVYERNLPILAKAMDDAELAPHLLGVHLEGPFINPQKGWRGAHPQEHILQPDIDIYAELHELAGGKLAILTLAPEMPGGLELLERARADGLVVTLAHHSATGATLARAVELGAALATHLGNGVPNERRGLQHEPTRSELATEDLSVSLITDGVHLPAKFIKGVVKKKGAAKVVVTSDASPFACMPEGVHESAGFRAKVMADGSIRTVDGEFLAGSGACMLDCMNHLASLGLLSEKELWQVGRDNALKLLGKKADKRWRGPLRYEEGRFTI